MATGRPTQPMTLRVAVLGGGIMGVTTAIRLASRGVAVTLFEGEDELMQGASRFNEGKIHLGCLYSASGSLDTARRVITGGLRFFRLVEEMLEMQVGQWITPGHDYYLVHRNSVVGPDHVERYMYSVADLLDSHPDRNLYPGEPRRQDFRRLALDESPVAVGSEVTACLQVPERSVATQPLADALVKRAREQPGLDILTGVSVIRAGFDPGTAEVLTSAGRFRGFDYVVNALWQGRPAVDKRTVGRCDEHPHHRYRVSLFVDKAEVAAMPSAVVAAGPFGDFKNYGGGRYYVSWYPAGLLQESTSVEPEPVLPPAGEAAASIGTALREGLSACLPELAQLDFETADTRVAGGWVYAQGRGSLGDPRSSLHRRDRLGVFSEGRYISVDTGKYSTAPHLASEIEAMILG